MTPKLLIRDVSEFSDLPDGLEKIEDVFIFDDSVRVHLCSLAGYLECFYLYSVLHCADDVDDEAREEFYEQYSYADQDVEYFSPGDPRIVDLNDEGDEETWEEIVEYYNCNHAY